MSRRIVSTVGRQIKQIRHPHTLAHAASSSEMEMALPLVFLSSNLSRKPTDWSATMHRFAASSYSSTAVHLDVPRHSEGSSKTLAAYEDELALAMADVHYPPVLFARGEDTSIAETWVSSHPVSALCLIGRPDSPHRSIARFDYEPTFPILLAALQQHRLWDVQSEWITQADRPPSAEELLKWIEEAV